jgi:lipoprotein signal peptidase
LFNVADSAIVVGVILLALTMLREERNDSSAPVPKSSESADSNPPASA